MDNKVIITVVLIFALVIALFGILSFQSGGLGNVGGVERNTISSTGSATITTSPDLVVVYFNAESTKSTAEAARDEVATKVENLKANLNGIVDESDIESLSLNIYPNYNWESGRNEVTSYTATHSLKIQSKEFNEAGKIVDAGVDAGALIQWINFELTKEHQNEVQKQAITEATKDAKSKAEAIAEGLGAKLGSVVSVNSNEGYYPPIYRLYESGVSADSAEKAVTDISPRSLETTATVSAVYKIR